MCLARTSHQLSAAAGDARHPAAFSHFGVLDVLSSTTPRPSSRKRHWIQHLAGLATKPGEKCGLDQQCERWFLFVRSLHDVTSCLQRLDPILTGQGRARGAARECRAEVVGRDGRHNEHAADRLDGVHQTAVVDRDPDLSG